MLQPERKYYTPEEYLALEESSDYRSEYYQGEIFAMSGGSANHNRIVRNLLVALTLALEATGCEAFATDLRLFIKKNGLYTYPDLMVICDQLEFVEGRTDTVINPVVIIEVLSKSTQDYDRGAKFELYRAIDTFQDYLLIDQSRVHVEYFHRLDNDRWILQEYNLIEDVLVVESISFELALNRIYQGVDWQKK